MGSDAAALCSPPRWQFVHVLHPLGQGYAPKWVVLPKSLYKNERNCLRTNLSGWRTEEQARQWVGLRGAEPHLGSALGGATMLLLPVSKPQLGQLRARGRALLLPPPLPEDAVSAMPGSSCAVGRSTHTLIHAIPSRGAEQRRSWRSSWLPPPTAQPGPGPASAAAVGTGWPPVQPRGRSAERGNKI